jgi:predicted  nucleic acid-binding Zn-ribbon protein
MMTAALLRFARPPNSARVIRRTTLRGASTTTAATAVVDIRLGIQKLIQEHKHSLAAVGRTAVVNTTTVQALDRAMHALQNQLDEARMCIQDCHDCDDTNNLPEELQTADKALAQAVASLVDLLDDLRSVSEPEQAQWAQQRQELVGHIKELRQQLDAATQRQQQQQPSVQ